MPLLNHQNQRVLFIHIPKTGGSSVERLMETCGPLEFKDRDPGLPYPCTLQHLHAEPLLEHFAPATVDWSFLIVRHPVARLVSEYRYQKRKPRIVRDVLSLSGWLSYAFARQRLNPWYRDNHFRDQAQFIYPESEIFRFEDGVDQVLSAVSNRLDCPMPDGGIHEKKSKLIPVPFTARDLDRIAKHYRADLDQFGYEMDKASLAAAGVEPPQAKGRI